MHKFIKVSHSEYVNLLKAAASMKGEERACVLNAISDGEWIAEPGERQNKARKVDHLMLLSKRRYTLSKNAKKPRFFGQFAKVIDDEKRTVEVLGLDHNEPISIVQEVGAFLILKQKAYRHFPTKYWLVDRRGWTLIDSKTPGHNWKSCLTDMISLAVKLKNQESQINMFADMTKEADPELEGMKKKPSVTREKSSVWLRRDQWKQIRRCAREEGHNKTSSIIERALDHWLNRDKSADPT